MNAPAIQTIPLNEQIKASQLIYQKALENLEALSDVELRDLLMNGASASTVARVLAIASDSTVARVLAIASASTVARVLAIASASTVDRVLAIASDSTVARVLAIASDSTVARVLAIASASTVDRVLAIASASTVARVLAIASASTVARVLAIASASTVDRVLAIASDSTVARVLAIASDSTVDRVQRLRNLSVPIVPDLDQRMYEVTRDGNLNMSSWHCGTTHCRAGWAITLAGEAGAALESAIGSEAAGRYIYEASTGRPAPDFFASTAAAKADIERCAGIAQ